MGMIVPDRVGVMTVDPGATTGCSQAVLNVGEADGVWSLLRSMTASGAFAREGFVEVAGVGTLEVFEVGGDDREQAISLSSEWREFFFRCTVELAIPVTQVFLVIEDWTPRLPLKSGERDVFTPVRIPARFLGMSVNLLSSDEREVVWQSASDAKTWATDKRLRANGLWVRGSDHKRDAVRHLAAFLDTMM